MFPKEKEIVKTWDAKQILLYSALKEITVKASVKKIWLKIQVTRFKGLMFT